MGLREDFIKDLNLSSYSQAENPLRVIGLTKEVLDLGLDNEGLHKFCLRRAKDLFAAFHEDVVKTPRTLELQAKYSAAFTALKNRQRFDGFLREFSLERSEDRAESVFLRRKLKEQTDNLERLVASERILSEENSSLRERQNGLSNNFAVYLRAMAADINFSKEEGWSSVAPLGGNGQIAVLSVRFPNRKDKFKEVPFGLEKRFSEGISILRNLSFFGGKSNEAFVDIYTLKDGKIDNSKILGCVDGRKNRAFFSRKITEEDVLVEFQEIEMLASIQPFMFFPGILIKSFSDNKVDAREKRLDKIIAEVRHKLMPREQKKVASTKGIQFSPRQMFLGFRTDE